MAHECKTLIVHCMDFRLGKHIKDYLEKNNLLGDCDIVSVAGGIKSLASFNDSADNFVLKQIETSINLHKIREIIISNHTDCGAYREMRFDSFKKECEFHIQEMEKAKILILNKYPDLKIKMLLEKILPSGIIKLEQITI